MISPFHFAGVKTIHTNFSASLNRTRTHLHTNQFELKKKKTLESREAFIQMAEAMVAAGVWHWHSWQEEQRSINYISSALQRTAADRTKAACLSQRRGWADNEITLFNNNDTNNISQSSSSSSSVFSRQQYGTTRIQTGRDVEDNNFLYSFSDVTPTNFTVAPSSCYPLSIQQRLFLRLVKQANEKKQQQRKKRRERAAAVFVLFRGSCCCCCLWQPSFWLTKDSTGVRLLALTHMWVMCVVVLAAC